MEVGAAIPASVNGIAVIIGSKDTGFLSGDFPAYRVTIPPGAPGASTPSIILCVILERTFAP
jgi:hypothetical protein